MIRALSKFAKLPSLVNGIEPRIIDVTSNSGMYRELSPFVLEAPPAKRFENLWQFSKVYKKFIMPIDGYPDASYYKWRDWGFAETRAHRYPMGKGAIPEYSLWDGVKLGYIEARKKIYAPEYAKNVAKTDSFKRLTQAYLDCLNNNQELILLDYDAPRNFVEGLTVIQAINNPSQKMGHAFVLVMMLTGTLDDCIKSPTKG